MIFEVCIFIEQNTLWTARSNADPLTALRTPLISNTVECMSTVCIAV